MNIIINSSSMQPIYEQIVEQVKSLILNNKLEENEALPSVRSLSKELRISSLTVKKAYDLLEDQGFISTVHGKGSYVNLINKSLVEEESKKQIEEDLYRVVKNAYVNHVSKEEISQLLDMIWGEFDAKD